MAEYNLIVGLEGLVFLGGSAATNVPVIPEGGVILGGSADLHEQIRGVKLNGSATAWVEDPCYTCSMT